MLVVRPTLVSPTTTTTPTPIGCKLLKINLLSTLLQLHCRYERCAFYRTYRLRQHLISKWLRGQDLNLRPSGYEPDELPDCSTPRLSQMKPRHSRSGTIAKRVWPRQHLRALWQSPLSAICNISNVFNRLNGPCHCRHRWRYRPTARNSRKPCTHIVQTM